MEHLIRIFDAILSDDIAFSFSVVIVSWGAISVILVWRSYWARKQYWAEFVDITPNGLTTLGLLGTFIGILIGLIDFDVERVDDSVPQLLAGLKIAFTTSVVGIASAILFRVIRTFVPSIPSQDVTPEKIHATLVNIRDSGQNATTQLDALRNAISSEGDSSLLTQVQKLRTTVQDGQNGLIEEFRQFAEHMVKNNQAALIEALEKVISDFNQNLTEQFGENFKQLNEAVHELVKWQDKYREHVDAQEKRIQDAVTAIESTQKALESIQTHSEHIPKAIEPLESALNGINSQTEMMNAHLKAFADLGEKAIGAFPIIENNLEKITTDLKENVDKISRQFTEFDQQMQQEVTKIFQTLGQHVASISEKLAEDYTPVLNELHRILQAVNVRGGAN